MTLNASIRDIPRPLSFDHLPVDARGFPIPWFVHVDDDGKPDHRIIDRAKLRRAVREERCWLCGDKLGRVKASVIGPMCAVNRIISEPPSHPQCARYSVLACPFLSKPRAQRNTKNLPEERQDAAGLGLKRNPGVIVIWESLAPSKPFKAQHGQPGMLFDLGAPHRVTWWREGRPATRDEAQDAISSGLPALLQLARLEGRAAIDAFEKALERVQPLLPKADPVREVA